MRVSNVNGVTSSLLIDSEAEPRRRHRQFISHPLGRSGGVSGFARRQGGKMNGVISFVRGIDLSRTDFKVCLGILSTKFGFSRFTLAQSVSSCM